MEFLWKIASGLGVIVLIEIGLIVAVILLQTIIGMFRRRNK